MIRMSLEYAIEYPCEMRRRYDEKSLRAFGRCGALVSRYVSRTMEGSEPPSDEGVQFLARHALEVERAEEAGEYCRWHCPAHLDEPGATEPIGCLGRISYPVEARFERFLADRVQLLFDTAEPATWPRLLHVLIDSESPFDGEATKALRRVTTADGLRFFEMRVPVQLARQAVRLTTDHLFDLLHGFASSDEALTGYQRELPVFALSDYGEFLDAILLRDMTEGEQERMRAAGISYTQY
ncbi:MAG: hypothetical protein ACKV2V_09200, partial [Blastocatellia bacterium]